MILDNTNGLSNLFEFKRNHFNSSFKQKMNLKIQILAGSTLISRFHVGFEIELPLTSFLIDGVHELFHFFGGHFWVRSSSDSTCHGGSLLL